jgi:hypothetical protein
VLGLAVQQPAVEQQLGHALGNAATAANPDELAAKANRAAGGAALGSWSLFVALVLPLGAAIAGGAIAAGRERRVAGVANERELRRRRPMVSAPVRTGELPNQPLPSA